jgi:hypothetical protein
VIRNTLVITLLLAGILSPSLYANDSGKLEPLYGAQFTDKHIIIRVSSSGCTRPEHFTIHVSGKGGTDYSVISIVRNRADRCRMQQHLVTLHLELPGALTALKEPYGLKNLFVSNSGFNRNSN